ncbi:hypothetical protein [Sphingomonas sp. SRS2]|uniref:hypothetical protein n=1 Tax=Sphingomonas sp. SRS2 TaxID=133190 RepID=UPI000697F0AC|nr:hypothetical protein [Sphingomonas sp. SRS2]
MTDHGIIFSAPMIRAKRAGRKTQTRRLASLPLGRVAVGDRLWVREAWRVAAWRDRGQQGTAHGRIAADYLATPEINRTPWAVPGPEIFDRLRRQSIEDAEKAIAAGRGSARRDGDQFAWNRGDSPCRGRPSIHMPRCVSRLTLIVEEVRHQQLHDIDEADGWAEGVCHAIEDGRPGLDMGDVDESMRRAIVTGYIGGGRRAFHWLWDQLHDKPGERWDDNPAIVALTFRVIEQNIDEVAR